MYTEDEERNPLPSLLANPRIKISSFKYTLENILQHENNGDVKENLTFKIDLPQQAKTNFRK